jgi:hypothetical protein
MVIVAFTIYFLDPVSLSGLHSVYCTCCVSRVICQEYTMSTSLHNVQCQGCTWYCTVSSVRYIMYSVHCQGCTVSNVRYMKCPLWVMSRVNCKPCPMSTVWSMLHSLPIAHVMYLVFRVVQCTVLYSVYWQDVPCQMSGMYTVQYNVHFRNVDIQSQKWYPLSTARDAHRTELNVTSQMSRIFSVCCPLSGLILSAIINWKVGLFKVQFKGTPSQEENKHILRLLMISCMYNFDWFK